MKQKLMTICCIALTSLVSAVDQFLQYDELSQLVVLGDVNVILVKVKVQT